MFYPRPPVGHQQMLPPRIHPTQHYVQHKCCEYIVPEVHPSHTTVINKHLYKHYHNFPHTVSSMDQVANQHFVCPPGPPVAPGTPVPGPIGAPGVAPVPRRRFF